MLRCTHGVMLFSGCRVAAIESLPASGHGDHGFEAFTLFDRCHLIEWSGCLFENEGYITKNSRTRS
jgi:hypothetical protein